MGDTRVPPVKGSNERQEALFGREDGGGEEGRRGRRGWRGGGDGGDGGEEGRGGGEDEGRRRRKKIEVEE